jgi:hypothetical protein
MFAFTKLMQAMVASGSVNDPYFYLTALLLNTSSTNGAQNNAFQDSSSNNYSITRAPASGPNAPTQGTFTPFSQTGWSNFFDGTDDYLSIADNVLLRFGAGAFTLEAWIYRRASGADHTIYAKGGASTGIVFQVTSTNVLRFTHTTTNIDSTGTIAANTWTHVAVVREGTGTNQTKLYINGTQDGQGTVSTDFTQTDQVRIGTDRSLAADFNGYISNLRFIKGAALYTTAFAPSTTSLTTTSQGANATQVELLTCQSNRFLDNSSNAFAITANGTPSVQAFSPFAPSIPYSTSVVGGSGHFDGTGDYLTVANATPLRFDTSDFTINCWIYRNVAGAIHTIASKGTTSAGWSLEVNASNQLQFTTGTSTVTTSVRTIPANTWTYVTFTREFDSVGENYVTLLFINGTYENDTTDATAISFNQTENLIIGGNRAATPANLFNGYIAGFEYIKGVSYLPTVPTAPPVKETRNPSLLLNFTNAGIFNAASKLNIETIGTAQASTTQTKFGTTSLFINGIGNYLIMPTPQAARFGSADWTIELFFRTTVASTRQILLVWNGLTDASGVAACGINLLANNKIGLQISENGTSLSINDFSTGKGSALSTNTWYYLAVTRSGATITVYIDGSSIGTYTLSSATVTLMANAITVRNVIGASTDLANQPFSGYIDEVRVTNGVARTITSTPTQAFQLE